MIGLGGPSLGLREKIAVWSQLSSGKLAQGAKVEKFETSFAKWVGAKKAVAVNSGTSALHIGNLSLGIGPGDEVIVPAFTFAASANSIALTGAKPVFCDVEEDYFTIDPNKIEKLITPKTKAIMAVHLYGQMCDMKSLKAIADKHGLFLIEDAAQAHGASIDGVPAGSWGDFAAFSFYPTKNMTTGEGGAITTDNEELVRMSKLLRNQGMLERYRNEVVGLNNRMTEISAVIGLEQLRRVDGFNGKRMRNAQILSEGLSGVGGISIPSIRQNAKHVFHQYTVRIDGDRDIFASELKKLGVDNAVYYPVPVNRLASFMPSEPLMVSEYLSKHCLSLPVHPSLTKVQLEKVTSSVRKVLGS